MLDLSFTFATLRIGLKSENSVFEKNLNLTISTVLLPPGGIAIWILLEIKPDQDANESKYPNVKKGVDHIF